MARLGVLLGPLVLVLWIFCVVDVITTRDGDARHLPKWGWLILVLLFPLVGSVAWLVAGRPRKRTRRTRPYERQAPHYPEYDRPGRAASPTPESDEKFLRRCRERAEEQRRRHAEQQRDDPDADNASTGEDPQT
jgi:hypothetical protein